MISGMLLMLAACEPTTIRAEGDHVLEWELEADAGPIPFGFWGLNGFQTPGGLEDVADRFGMTVFHTSTRHPNYAVTDLLPMVRDAGLSVNLRLVGDHEYYTDDDGDFSLSMWKEMMEPWRDERVQEFVDDGTLSHHMMLDDIYEFPGEPPSGDQLDEMAALSAEILPGLRTMVRAEASDMPRPSKGAYEHVDACVNQYTARHGDIEWYAAQQMEAGQRLGLDLVMGLNIANGGDGSSDQPGWSEGNWAMSPEEIEHYGYVLTGVDSSTEFLNWEYDGEEEWSDGSVGSDYFDQDELVEALSYLAERVTGGG